MIRHLLTQNPVFFSEQERVVGNFQMWNLPQSNTSDSQNPHLIQELFSSNPGTLPQSADDHGSPERLEKTARKFHHTYHFSFPGGCSLQ